MDVTCLKSFNFPEPYFFRNHWKLKVVGNIMKVPPSSQLMKNCFELAKTAINEKNKNWHKPIEILNKEIEQLDLMKYRRIGLFNLDLSHVIQLHYEKDYPIPNDWYGIHWINSSGAKKIKRGSTFSRLLNQFDVPH